MITEIKPAAEPPIRGFLPPTMPRRTLLNIQTPTDMSNEIEEHARLESSVNAPSAASPLIAHLLTLLDRAKRAREDGKVDRMLREAQLALNSAYPSEKLNKIKEQGSSDIFVHLTETKFNHACSWVSDMRSNLDGRDWDIEPTPIPNVSEEIKAKARQQAELGSVQDFNAGHPYPSPDELEAYVASIEEQLKETYEKELQEKAKEAVDAMRKEMGDQLLDCDWDAIIEDFEAYVIGFGTGFLKGPVIRWHKELSWGDDPVNPKTVRRAIPTLETPNPLDIFPVAGATDTQSGLFERLWLTHEDLLSYKGLPHYKDEGINELVSAYPDGKTDAITIATDTVRDSQEQKPTRVENAGGRYECWEYWGPVSGDKLLNWGVKGVERTKTYSMQVIWSGNWPIKIMPNPDPLGVVQYFKAVFKKRPGSFWGKPMPHLMADGQDITNASWRAIIDNEGMGSGPQVTVDIDAVLPDDVGVPHPRKVWRYRGSNIDAKAGGGSRKPVAFDQPDNNAHELLALAREGATMADNATGVPAYSYGSDKAAGAGKTASGYSMMLNAASRGLKHSLKNMDKAKEGFLRNLYRWNMLYSDKVEIKGDAQIQVKGTIRVIVEELQQARIQEFVAYVEKSPMGQKLIGLEGFNKLIQEYARTVHVNPTDIFPSEEELKSRIQDEKEAMMQELMTRMQAAGAPPVAPEGGGGFQMPSMAAA